MCLWYTVFPAVRYMYSMCVARGLCLYMYAGCKVLLVVQVCAMEGACECTAVSGAK
jgi:hypothetical protein